MPAYGLLSRPHSLYISLVSILNLAISTNVADANATPP